VVVKASTFVEGENEGRILPGNAVHQRIDQGRDILRAQLDAAGLIVVSPFAKKHYVSHTVADYTAILKLIETRFSVASLTARDAKQPDMTEFFNFTNPQWKIPPTTPAQITSNACYLNMLP